VVKGSSEEDLFPIESSNPVVAGLFLYLLLSRSGPLGSLELLYTPTAKGPSQKFIYGEIY
jgi:ABC-type tungstate transport system substrate-binding protein